jgi:hypothetical protein
MKKGELVYDYEKQEYVDSEGQFVSCEYENFPCPKCASPADMQFITSYYEAYKCEAEDCRHSFTVK